LTGLKVEPAIARKQQKVQAIRVYPSKVLLKEIDSSVERGETPSLMVKKEFSEERKAEEVSLVFKGPYHIEDLNYYQKDPATWSTWGEIYLTPAQALQLAEKIKHITKARAGEPGQMVLVKLANMTINRQAVERLMAMVVSQHRSRPSARSRRRRR
jgi:hypothetical protein